MNKRIKTALILIAVILIAALAISLAYSRYFSEVTGTGEAVVAKWKFEVNGQADTIDTIVLGNTLSENSKVAEGKIAPGTSGNFKIELDATGTEVALDYTIEFKDATGAIPTNLKFYTTKNEDGTYANEMTDILTGTMGVTDSDKTKTVDIYWVWEYQTGEDEASKETNDGIDTLEGQAAESITFDVVVTGIQQENK